MIINGAEKLVYLTVGVIFLVLGVVGLVMPLLPGVLFLAGALYLLSRGSNRIKRLADGNPTLREFQSRMDRMDAVSLVQQAQLAGLMLLRGVVFGVSKVFAGVRKLLS